VKFATKPPVIAKQRVVMVPGNQTKEGTGGHGGKDFKKETFKTRVENV